MYFPGNKEAIPNFVIPFALAFTTASVLSQNLFDLIAIARHAPSRGFWHANPFFALSRSFAAETNHELDIFVWIKWVIV
jgi:hypothetical protein